MMWKFLVQETLPQPSYSKMREAQLLSTLPEINPCPSEGG